ncbi:MAG: hypothetical protein Q7J10_09535 [Methanosarcinaceae archaeon]|nr:hypothetical protein [Methanosarcinaceae archaeon]
MPISSYSYDHHQSKYHSKQFILENTFTPLGFDIYTKKAIMFKKNEWKKARLQTSWLALE